MLPLEGIKVLDLSNYVPGALCTMILADMGAEVIKIEPSEPLAFEGVGYSVKGEDRRRETAFFTLNRNKKSLGLNLRSEAGRDIFLKMAKDADVAIERISVGRRQANGDRLRRDKQSQPRGSLLLAERLRAGRPLSALPRP
jgi:formyl-CoA transferase